MDIDLTTKYLGFHLVSPVVVSSCPLTSEMDVLHKIQESGAGAAVLPSLFEEQIEQNDARWQHNPAFHVDAGGRSLSYFRELQHYNRGPDAYVRYIRQAKKAVSIPLFASLNGISEGGWVRYASQLQDAGADALELNIYYLAADPTVTAEQVEARYLRIVAAVRKAVSIPLAVKVGPYFTSLANMAGRFVAAGADGLVLFNRFLQPDIDVDSLKISPRLALSTPDELRLPLRWVAILRGQLQVSLAATGGIHDTADVIKALLAGADVAMVTSTLYRHGIEHLRTLVDQLRFWLDANEHFSVEQIKGSLSQANCPDPSAFERANYTKAVSSFGNHD